MIIPIMVSIVTCSLQMQTDTTIALPGKYLTQVKQKSDHIEQQVDKRTAQTLDRFSRQEKKMQAKLWKVDSVAAKNIFSRSIDSLNGLKAGLGRKINNPLTANAGGAYLDTLQNSLKFLQGSGAASSQLASATASVDNLQNSLQQAEQVKAYLREQKQLLKAQLANYSGFGNDITKLNKEAYYYGQQLKEYKATLSDKKKVEEKATALLKSMPAYNNFIKEHSQYASLFKLIGAGSTSLTSLSGFQTRSQVEQLIGQRVGNEPGAQAAVSQQLAQAKSQLNELKDKYADVGTAADMPDFKPNPMKTKRFLQRLEFGGNVQFQRASSYYPTTTDIAGQVGYKFHKNGTIGIGVSYKLGMGTGWNDIAFSHQGVGLRSYIDWKLKGTFYVNGGFEENYQTAFTHLSQLYDITGWQSSALLGISKKYKINARLKGNMMVLYDFLASKQFPSTSSIKIRFGYTF